MSATVGEKAAGSYENAGGYWVVSVVPQIPHPTNWRQHPHTVRPTCELLLPVWIPNGVDLNAAHGDFPELLWRRDERYYATVDTWLAGRFPPHTVEPIRVTDYQPLDHRPRALDLGEHQEWVTVVFSARSGVYKGLNDDEFAHVSSENSEDIYVLGQTVRPVSPDSTLLRTSDTLIGLFGVQNNVAVHMPTEAAAQFTATA